MLLIFIKVLTIAILIVVYSLVLDKFIYQVLSKFFPNRELNKK